MDAQQSLFKKNIKPLSENMRPKNLDDIFGQEHLLAQGAIFRKLVENDSLGSVIFWGPPGTGKTTIANVIANITERKFITFHAAFNGAKEVKDVIELAQKEISFGAKSLILFVDEIHRFNKAQQDLFLKPIEHGQIILIGATTENPSFAVNNALLSRCSVYALNQLKDIDLEKIINKILEYYKALNKQVLIDEQARKILIDYSNGDARNIINIIELAVSASKGLVKNCVIITVDIIKELLSTRKFAYDKNGEQHYNLLSALHKSIRGSDAQAGIYWLARLLESGADPLIIVRRLIVAASEDVGLADPDALLQAIAVKHAIEHLGLPECKINLSQLVIYLATAPKSNSAYIAINNAIKDVHEKNNLPVPLNICNAESKLMTNLGYGAYYKYDHEFKYHYAGQEFLPEDLKNSIYYSPGDLGFEKEIKRRIEFWKNLKESHG
ncbi:MAG: AAA ATPase central domain protein [candidate division TM6 bacterium GW2011_GWF2_28_16]|nr:MAG: AAA ATPase central domain protein [candidate division TM6 bacterium GW2011_GWF2_28_16]